MHTLKLNVDDKIYDKLIWFLKKFSKDELEIIVEDVKFQQNKKYLESELQEINEGKGIYFTTEEVEKRLDKIIEKHENNL
jgi:hypothetical protein